MTATGGAKPLEVLTFALNGEILALEAPHVREILDLTSITLVPGAPAYLNGLINVRGKVVPLADLCLRLGMAPRPATIDTRIIVVEIEIGGQPTTVGLRADKVYEMTEVAIGLLEDTPRIGMRWRSEFIRCIGKRDGDFLTVLNVQRILAEEEARDAPPIPARVPLAVAVS